MTRGERAFGFGLVGCGGAARDIARGIAATKGARLVAAHGATPEGSMRALLARNDVDAVVVALPHDRLARTAVTALCAGRHVLVEKPGATSAAGVRSIRDAAASNDRRVGVMLELRNVATVGAARELVANGAVGRLRAVRIRTLIDKPPSYWSSGPTGAVQDSWRASRARAGGGVVLMNTIHQLDLVRAISGLEPLRVAGAIAAGVPGVDVEDVAAATVEWSDGVIGSIVAAAHAPGATDEETIEIDADAGALRLGDPYAERPTLRWLSRASNAAPDAAPHEWHTITMSPTNPFAATIAAFVDAIRTDRPPVPGLAEVDVALATVLALYRSARTGRFETVRPVGPANRGSEP